MSFIDVIKLLTREHAVLYATFVEVCNNRIHFIADTNHISCLCGLDITSIGLKKNHWNKNLSEFFNLIIEKYML